MPDPKHTNEGIFNSDLRSCCTESAFKTGSSTFLLNHSWNQIWMIQLAPSDQHHSYWRHINPCSEMLCNDIQCDEIQHVIETHLTKQFELAPYLRCTAVEYNTLKHRAVKKAYRNVAQWNSCVGQTAKHNTCSAAIYCLMQCQCSLKPCVGQTVPRVAVSRTNYCPRVNSTDHIIPYFTFPNQTIPYHPKPNHTILYQTIPCNISPKELLSRGAGLKWSEAGAELIDTPLSPVLNWNSWTLEHAGEKRRCGIDFGQKV